MIEIGAPGAAPLALARASETAWKIRMSTTIGAFPESGAMLNAARCTPRSVIPWSATITLVIPATRSWIEGRDGSIA